MNNMDMLVRGSSCMNFDWFFVIASAVDHLVNTVSLGHTFYFEEAIDTSVFPPLMVRTKCLVYNSNVLQQFRLNCLSSWMSWSCGFVGHKFLGKCLSNICCIALLTREQWPSYHQCIGGELVAFAQNELIFSKHSSIRSFSFHTILVLFPIGTSINFLGN